MRVSRCRALVAVPTVAAAVASVERGRPVSQNALYDMARRSSARRMHFTDLATAAVVLERVRNEVSEAKTNTAARMTFTPNNAEVR